MTASDDSTTGPGSPRRVTWPRVLGIVALTVLVSVGLSIWLISTYVFPTAFEPTLLDASENRVLEAKLDGLEAGRRSGEVSSGSDQDWLSASEPYSETGAVREIRLTERELNALVARDRNLAERLAIDLSDDLLSARLLVPLDPAFPILGGRTVRLHAGLELAYRNGRPVAVLRGLSIMGVPLPSAWLGGLKNVDLVEEFGGSPGFWRSFAEGIDSIAVEQGELEIRLRK